MNFEKEEVEHLVKKARILGALDVIYTSKGTECYIISQCEDTHFVIIPNEVKSIKKYKYHPRFSDAIGRLRGKIIVAGGKNLTDASGMFMGVNIEEIDLSKFDTSKVTDMHDMFYNSHCISVNLDRLDLSNVENMESMFERSYIPNIKLTGLRLSNIRNMSHMFERCTAKSIDLDGISIRSNTKTIKMFNGCCAEIKATDSKILKEMKVHK